MFFQVKSFGAWIGADEQFNSVLFGGLLGSLFSFLQFVASPLVGGLSDHFGRRPLLLLSTAGVALSYALWANASTFGLFVLARIIGGLSKGMNFFTVWIGYFYNLLVVYKVHICILRRSQNFAKSPPII